MTCQFQNPQARIAFEKALVDLRHADGRLLDELGVELEAPEAPHPVNFFRSVIPIKPYEE
ncbi:MAG TPA: hypothetical protein VMZ06_13775 [Candidatus Bathyarchaeia archaeon]|nr:hypothetical protein [Candidatus Bathyarchaeia archaeon]